MDIRLAPWSMEDAEALAFLMERADRRYLSDRLPKPYTLENARWWLEMVAQQEGKTGLFRKILVDGHMVGNISAEGQEDIYRKDAVLGYVLDKEQWGRRIMSRAVELFCPLVFDRLDVLRLSARVLEENIPSRRVLEKNGFQLEGVVKLGAWKEERAHDLWLYGKLKNQNGDTDAGDVFAAPDVSEMREVIRQRRDAATQTPAAPQPHFCTKCGSPLDEAGNCPNCTKE